MKGMQLPINVVVIVAIAVLVVVTLSASLLKNNTPDCQASGGFCAAFCSDGYHMVSFTCPKEVSSCCLPVSGGNDVEIIQGDLFP